MNNPITIKNDNEREFLQLIRTSDEDGIRFLLNALLCIATFGKAFLDEAQPLTIAGDREGLIAITNRYTALLPQNNT